MATMGRRVGSFAVLALLAATTPSTAATADADTACATYSRAIRDIVVARNRGVTLAAVILGLQRTAPAVAAQLSEDARDLYGRRPAVRDLSPDGAEMAYRAACAVEQKKRAGGGRRFEARTQIAEQLAGFRTHSGQPLATLLRAYGVEIGALEVLPATALPHGGMSPGEVLYAIEWARGPSRKMPCRLSTWFKPGVAALGPAEALRKDGQFPYLEPDSMDPVLYWAATGKCSEAYSF